MRSVIKFVDLFAGAGGFSEGFEESGRFRSLLAVDSHRPVAQTYKANFPHAAVLVEDVKRVSEAVIGGIVGRDGVDLVIGSPPCEPFTGANPRRERRPIDRLYNDPAGSLTLHFIRLVGLLRPKVFVMENVPAIMSGGLRDALRAEFRRAGYETIYFNVLRAHEHGTPSRRTRVFVSNIPIRPARRDRRVTVEEALRGLPEPGPWPPNHDPPPRLAPRKLKRASSLRWGEAMIYYRGARRELPNFVRLDPRDVAPTVMGSSRFIHPYENRLLTVREHARLMGFPDNFVFFGGRDEQYNMVGEAVPPPLSKAIAEYIAEVWDEVEAQ
ncbi:MAG: DNA cytosine methyltransferase [Desulfurococcaceae archaeon]